MMEKLHLDKRLTKADLLVLETLALDAGQVRHDESEPIDGEAIALKDADEFAKSTIETLDANNDPASPEFEPTIFTSIDYDAIKWERSCNAWLLRPYIRFAQHIVRVETDVVMFTHLLLYFTTSLPSAIILFLWRFTWIHGLLHFAMQVTYMGTYTLMMHQHIHMRGILKKHFAIFDHLFPYLTDPLHGHTWNTYFYHHVKHHHVEANGPGDLSSTIRYQRDNIFHLLHYIGKFYFLVWIELPLYFLRTRKYMLALKVFFWEMSSYTSLYLLFRFHPQATTCVFILPLMLMRLGLMVGNWAQHAFIDENEPDSDFRSSITLVDVQSNRHSFNDGYHTSHHLNPLRHWREHPNHFLKQRELYATQKALVFYNIDYIMITIRLMMRDYKHLARCMIPIGEEQIKMSLDDRVAMLKRHLRRFSEEEIRAKFKH